MRSLLVSLLIHSCLVLLLFAAWVSVPRPPEEVPVELRLASPRASAPIRPEKPRPAKPAQAPALTSPSNEPASSTSASSANAPASDNSMTGPGAAAEEYEVSELPLLLNEVRIPYPPEARAKRLQGAVVFDLVVSSSGDIASFRVLQSPGPELSDAASNAIRKFKFKPAKIGDKSVAIRIRYTYRFMIE